jgi:hypothetical protein
MARMGADKKISHLFLSAPSVDIPLEYIKIYDNIGLNKTNQIQGKSIPANPLLSDIL